MALSVPAAGAQEDGGGRGFYGGGEVGLFFDGDSCDAARASAGTDATVSCDDDSVAVRFSGGVQLNDNVAVEVGYTSAGETTYVVGGTVPLLGGGNATDANIPIEVAYSAFDLSVLGVLPLNESFSVYGRAGLAFWDADVGGGVGTGTVNGSPDILTLLFLQDDSGEDLLYGLGAKYVVNDSIDVRVNWTRVDADGTDVDVIAVGGSFRF